MDLDLVQTLVNGLAIGSSTALVALGLAVVFNATGIFHIAQGGVFLFAAYFTYLGCATLRWPFWLAVLLSLVLSTLLGVACELLVYRPMRARRATSHTLFIASLGLLFGMEGFAALFWGSNPKMYPVQPLYGALRLGDLVLTYNRVATFGVSVLLTLLVCWLLLGTRLGKSIRALSNNPERAMLVGINVPRLLLVVFALGSALAVAPAVLQGMDRGTAPEGGLVVILLAGLALILGGFGSLPGAVLGAYVLGILTSFATRYIGGEWSTAAVFVLLILILLVRPRGFFGERDVKVQV